MLFGFLLFRFVVVGLLLLILFSSGVVVLFGSDFILCSWCLMVWVCMLVVLMCWLVLLSFFFILFSMLLNLLNLVFIVLRIFYILLECLVMVSVWKFICRLLSRVLSVVGLVMVM